MKRIDPGLLAMILAGPSVLPQIGVDPGHGCRTRINFIDFQLYGVTVFYSLVSISFFIRSGTEGIKEGRNAK